MSGITDSCPIECGHHCFCRSLWFLLWWLCLVGTGYRCADFQIGRIGHPDWALAALTSNPIGGAFVPNAETHSFWEMQLFAGVMMAAGSTGYVVVWIHLRRVKAKERVEDV